MNIINLPIEKWGKRLPSNLAAVSVPPVVPPRIKISAKPAPLRYARKNSNQHLIPLIRRDKHSDYAQWKSKLK